MKSFPCVVLLAALVAAEPPSYRSRFFQRQEAEPTTPRNEEAPYPAAGYKPSKEFKLPSREAVPPATSYGVPSDSYAVPFHTFNAPQTEYGVPRKSEEPEREKEDKEEVESLKVEGLPKETKGKLQENSEVVNANGAYYVLLPDSQLQRVQYETQNDVRNMAYTARLQYRNEDRAPIYVYTAVPQYQNAAYVQVL
ncbi:uncharacterized protein LOC134668261 [Cydia fagiglandana]|uniref:uncharacterized protein LOC134668261 n=1 Tax=Cydia fagiglandana TaxID=1458189 RepID=UPI002FEE5761